MLTCRLKMVPFQDEVGESVKTIGNEDSRQTVSPIPSYEHRKYSTESISSDFRPIYKILFSDVGLNSSAITIAQPMTKMDVGLDDFQ